MAVTDVSGFELSRNVALINALRQHAEHWLCRASHALIRSQTERALRRLDAAGLTRIARRGIDRIALQQADRHARRPMR